MKNASIDPFFPQKIVTYAREEMQDATIDRKIEIHANFDIDPSGYFLKLGLLNAVSKFPQKIRLYDL